MSTTVLVTGANGQLASCIKDIETLYPNLNFIYTDYLELDICDTKQVELFFKENKPIHYCINCAAYTNVDKAETDAEKAFEINATGTKNMANICFVNNTVLSLLFLSSNSPLLFAGNSNATFDKSPATNSPPSVSSDC